MSSGAPESGSKGGRGGRGGRGGGGRGGGRGGRGGDNAPEQRASKENISETSSAAATTNGGADQGTGNRGGKTGGGRTYDDSAFNKLVDKENATLANIAKKQEEARKQTVRRDRVLLLRNPYLLDLLSSSLLIRVSIS